MSIFDAHEKQQHPECNLHQEIFRPLEEIGSLGVSVSEVYRSRPIKARRTKDQLKEILQASREIIAEESCEITIRHLFYRLVSQKLLAKDEKEYKKLGTYLMKWRRSGELPWSAFADNTRWYYGNVGYSGIEAALINTRDTYRRNLWATQDAFVEIWCEKDAIASILLDEAISFGVQVFPLRGFTSGSALHNAADSFKTQINAGKTIYVYYFGDYDPSGIEIDKSAVRNLHEDHGVEVNFERIAVTPDHIKSLNLPTRPPKLTDTRTKNFKGESVEIDALRMPILKGMVRQCIVQHIDQAEWDMQLRIEEQEKSLLDMLAREMGEAV